LLDKSTQMVPTFLMGFARKLESRVSKATVSWKIEPLPGLNEAQALGDQPNSTLSEHFRDVDEDL
jgi:hypothetical protein